MALSHFQLCTNSYQITIFHKRLWHFQVKQNSLFFVYQIVSLLCYSPANVAGLLKTDFRTSLRVFLHTTKITLHQTR